MPIADADSLFVQDNVHLYMARQTLKFLKEVEIARLEWQLVTRLEPIVYKFCLVVNTFYPSAWLFCQAVYTVY